MSTESSAGEPATANFNAAEIRQRVAGLSGSALISSLLNMGVISREYSAGTIKMRDSPDVLQQSLNSMVKRDRNVSGLAIEVPGSQWARLFFPANLLGGDAPRLGGLYLTNCSLPGPLPIFRGLTRLSIRIYPPPTFPAPVYLSELLNFLDSTPFMVRLELDDAFKSIRLHSEVVPQRKKVHLPYLESLAAEGSGTECKYLLENLSLPEACEVRLIANADGTQEASTLALMCAVDQLVQHCRARPRPFTHVGVVYRGDSDRNVVRVGFSPAFFYRPNGWWHNQCGLTLNCTPEHRAHVYRLVLLRLFRSLQGMESIAFEGAEHVCEHCTTDMLGDADFFSILGGRNLDGVHTVRMPFGPVAAFCESLRVANLVLPTGQVVEGSILRGLKTLILGDRGRGECGELSDDEEDSGDQEGSGDEELAGDEGHSGSEEHPDHEGRSNDEEHSDDEQQSEDEGHSDDEEGSDNKEDSDDKQRLNERRIRVPYVDDALVDMVRRRIELQVPLERLEIKGHGKREREFIDSLHARVGDVVQIEEMILEDIGKKRCTHV